MRTAVLLLFLGALLLPGSRTCLAETQVERRSQTESSAEHRKTPATIERSRSRESIERESGSEDTIQDSSAAEINYSQKKSRIERSNQPLSYSDLQAESEKESPAVEENPDRQYLALLAEGWNLYQDGNYAKAIAMFTSAGESPAVETQLQSELGIAYSLIQQDEKPQAIDYLTSLVARGYRLPTTSEVLAPLLVETGRLNEAQTIIKHLPHSRRVAMKKLIAEKRLHRRVEKAIATDDRSLLSKALSDAHSRLEACQDTDYFYRAALAMNRFGAASEAVDLLEKLADCRPDDREWQVRLLTQKLRHLDDPQLIEALHYYAGTELYGSDLAEVGQGIVWQRLDTMKENNPVRRSLIETLLLLNPEDLQAMRMLAWNCYQHADYECGEHYFRQLLKDTPSDNDALEGLFLTLAEAGNTLEAIAAAKSFPGKPTSKLRNLLVDLYARLGQQAYENEDYASADEYLSAAVKHAPERRDLFGLLQWTRYRLGRPDGVVTFLREEYEKNPVPETARAYLDILRETEQLEKRVTFVTELAENSDQNLRRLAAEDYYARGWLMRAASTDDSATTCYSGCDRPGIDTTISVRARNGENGTSRLDAMALSADLKLQAYEGRQWNLRLTPLTIESGTAPDDPFVGSYYHVLANPDLEFEELTTGYNLVQPELGLVQEGERFWQFLVGMTPVGGPIDPLPTFSATGRDEQWRLKLVQESVRESILSWVGLEDPYSRQKWGRVVRTGVSLRRTIDLEGPWWLSMDGEYHYYWGENVADNQRLGASFSWGRTDRWHELMRAVGLFTAVSGFEDNVNFFTSGHGGYYSPELMVIAGPFVRLTSKSCSRFWWDGQLSMGYSYRRTESAPRYRNTPDYVPGLSTAADSDVSQVYAGTRESQLTMDGRLRGIYSLGSSWFLEAEAGINNSSDFTEVQAAISLTYRFGGGSGLCVTAAQADTSLIPIR